MRDQVRLLVGVLLQSFVNSTHATKTRSFRLGALPWPAMARPRRCLRINRRNPLHHRALRGHCSPARRISDRIIGSNRESTLVPR
jgi:hypothetical protein